MTDQITLTPREINIVRLIAQGKTHRQTAVILGISEDNVGNHVQRIYQKLDIRGLAQLVRYALENSIIS